MFQTAGALLQIVTNRTLLRSLFRFKNVHSATEDSTRYQEIFL